MTGKIEKIETLQKQTVPNDTAMEAVLINKVLILMYFPQISHASRFQNTP